ncbi:M35 family metallo-endopeptidase [Paraburkholderia lacunae]|nr:M35 family metallo-endopeptidase [Paraburkholderia lacunae]
MTQQAANETLHLFVTGRESVHHREPHFCTLPDAELWQACRMKVLIHECTHFTDTFNSDDVMYGQGTGMKYWAPSDPDGAIRNADSIACYVAHFDKKLW